MPCDILHKVSYHAVYDDSVMEALQYDSSNGFSGIQFACEIPHFSFEALSAMACTNIRDFVERNELRIALHAPDETVSLFESNTHLRQGIFDYYRALFEFAENLGARMITIHLGTLPTWRTDTAPEEVLPQATLSAYIEVLKRNLHELIQLADDRFILVCENYKLD